jgi:D-alanyl-D-alanine carboxypeptidase
MARLSQALWHDFPEYYHYFSTPSFSWRRATGRNHNHLLGQVEGVDGIKTGYTRASGFNLVTSMHRGQRHVVAVVLGGRSGGQRDARMRELLAEHIMTASTRQTSTVLAEAAPEPEPSDPIPMPPARLRTEMVEASASIDEPMAVAAFVAPVHLEPGSTAPIKPRAVKTVSIRPATAVSAKAKHIATLAAPAAVELPEPRPTKVAVVIDEKPAKHAANKAAQHKARSGWMIQVGAFGELEEARVRLSSAKKRAKKLLGEADPFTEPVTKGEKTFYRARFAGLDKHQAVAACRALKRSDIACLALKN